MPTDALAWLGRDGVEEKLLEANSNRRTALVRLPPGAMLPVAGGGCVDILVIDGTLVDAYATYPARTYLHDEATAHLGTTTGCTAFVKHRPTEFMGRWVVDTTRLPFGAADVQGLAVAPLYADAGGRVTLLRFEPGAALARHRHDLGEEFFVLAGELDDDHGRYAPRWWVRQPPGSEHAVRSAAGATTLTFADHLTTEVDGPRPGDRIAGGGLRLDAVVSQGGKCTVFAATEVATGRRLAVKVLTTGWQIAELVQRLMKEASVLGQIASPHVVHSYGVGVLDAGQPYLTMELIDGASPRGPLPANVAAEIVAQACVGLAAAHARGIVHRDIKPANLLVGATPEGALLVKLVSFGVALQLPVRQMASGPLLIGSPPYMPPEQVVGSRLLDPRADVWALGVTLYELLSGTVPFRGATLADLAAAIASSVHPPIPGVPPPIAAVIDRCLAKERDRRFASADELAAALATRR